MMTEDEASDLNRRIAEQLGWTGIELVPIDAELESYRLDWAYTSLRGVKDGVLQWIPDYARSLDAVFATQLGEGVELENELS